MEENIEKQLDKESKERKKILNQAINEINMYSKRMLENEQTLENAKIDQVKYKTEIKELNDYVEIYKKKSEDLKIDNEKQEKEVMRLRKQALKNEIDLNSLKSILEVFIKELGLEEVQRITKLSKKKLNELVKEVD